MAQPITPDETPANGNLLNCNNSVFYKFTAQSHAYKYLYLYNIIFFTTNELFIDFQLISQGNLISFFDRIIFIVATTLAGIRF